MNWRSYSKLVLRVESWVCRENREEKRREMSQMAPRSESSSPRRLYDFAKSALIKIFSHPYATVSLSISFHFPLFFSIRFFFILWLFIIIHSMNEGLRALLWWRRWCWQMGRRSNCPLHWNWYVFIQFIVFYNIFVLYWTIGLLVTTCFHVNSFDCVT